MKPAEDRIAGSWGAVVTVADQEKTGLGNYFIANYPPFSFWKAANLPDAKRAFDSAPKPGTPLGLYQIGRAHV